MRKLWFVLILVLVVSSVQAQNNPRGIVEAFLNAWDASDYGRMYDLIHSMSREQFSQNVFELRYQDMQENIALTGLDYTIRSVKEQGESAAVIYDVVLESESFGTIDDPNRTMRVMRDDGRWRVAWSTMDIFDGLVNDGQVRRQALTGTRAPIYDRNGEILAADSGVTVSMYSSQDRMNSVQDCLNVLGRVTLENIASLEVSFSRYSPETVFFLGEVPVEVYERNQGDIATFCGASGAGSIYNSIPHRTYYGGAAAVHVTGYVGPIPAEEAGTYAARGYPPGALIGLAGVERAYEDNLAGRPELVLRIVDSGGTIIRELAGTGGIPATSVTLTIDRDLQQWTSQALADAYNRASGNWGNPSVSPGGAAVVIDVNTGGILALTSYPMFNPSLFNPNGNTPNRGAFLTELVSNPQRPLVNRAVQEQQSPGSVFKVITAAAALNEGFVTPNDTFLCELYWDGRQYGDTAESREDWRVVSEEPAAGVVTPAQALMASCNPFFWEYGAIMYNNGAESAVIDYAQQMGLGTSFGFDGAFREARGELPAPTNVEDAINEAIGQGNITLPPIQMVAATMAIANGGTVYKPHLLQQVGGQRGEALVEIVEPEVLNTLDFNPGVMEALQAGMCGVVSDPVIGTAHETFISANYTVCGKTGTAQTARYPNAWFISFAPAENPQIATVVMVEQSVGGSSVAAPITRRILDGYFGQSVEDYFYPDWWWQEAYEAPDTPAGNR
jgi:penicillin-binding protein 2